MTRAGAAAKKVLIVDDHPIVRHGLAQLIGQEKDLAVCGEAGTYDEALAALARGLPDVVILDLSLPGPSGLSLLKRIRELYPELPVLVLSMHEESVYAERALRAGANGYVMKGQADSAVIEALRKVLAGELYLSPESSTRLLQQFLGRARGSVGPTGIERLSDRELEVFECIGRGLSSQKIAEKLGMSVKTVEVHRVHIKRKLGIENGAQLMREAVRWVEREAGGS